MTGGRFQRGKLVASGNPNKPYFVPFQRCIIDIAVKYVPDGGAKLHVFCGLDSSFGGYAVDLFKQIKESRVRFAWKDKLGDLSLPQAKETPELQAADFLVHLTYQHMLAGAKTQIENRRPSPLLALCIQNRRSGDDFYFMNRGNLEESKRMAMILAAPMRPYDDFDLRPVTAL